MTDGHRTLSELEGVTIGVVHRIQPCTAYAVRRALRQSPSSHWRASAGSIYPLLARLEYEGLITGAEDVDDGRGRKLLAVTPAGRKMLKAWIKAVADPEYIANVFDPVRSRVFFLAALTEAEQVQFAKRTLEALEHHLKGTEDYLATLPGDANVFEQLGAMLGVTSARSRIQSMKAVLKQLRTRTPQ